MKDKIGPSHSDLFLLLFEVKWWIVKAMFMDLCQFELLGANSSKRTMNKNFCRSEVLVEKLLFSGNGTKQGKAIDCSVLILADYDLL